MYRDSRLAFILAAFVLFIYSLSKLPTISRPTKSGQSIQVSSPSNSSSKLGAFYRDLNTNLRADISIDGTCTLPYVSRSCYALIADYIYDEKVKNVEPVGQLKNGDAILLSTKLCDEFFQKVFPQITTYVILISYYEDYELASKYAKYLNDEAITVWFACNPGFYHPKLVVLPIGFENTNWHPPNIKLIRNVDFSSLKPWPQRRNLLYINFEERTNLKARSHLKGYFKNFPGAYIHHEHTGFSTYLTHLNDSKFVLCPRGNGLDTHRFYETILMGAIPIVEDSLLRPIFNQNRSIILKDFRELSTQMLQRPDEYIKDMNFSKNILYFNAWLQLIDNFKVKYMNIN